MYAAYLRTSTEHQTLDMQRVAIERYLKSNQIEDVIFYEEVATGTNTKRQKFQQLLMDLREGRITTIITYKLDRLFRSLGDLVSTLRELEELKVNFISIQDHIDLTTATGRLMVHLLGSFAEFEAEVIRERVKSGLAAARLRGKKFGRPRIYDHQEVLNLHREGVSCREISRRLGISKSAVSAITSARKLSAVPVLRK